MEVVDSEFGNQELSRHGGRDDVKNGFGFQMTCFLFDSLRPINNLSVKQGWVFLG